MEAIFTGIITNLPNLAGLVVLAYVLNKQYGDLLAMYGELLTKYHELVTILSVNKQITPEQMRELRRNADQRENQT